MFIIIIYFVEIKFFQSFQVEYKRKIISGTARYIQYNSYCMKHIGFENHAVKHSLNYYDCAVDALVFGCPSDSRLANL